MEFKDVINGGLHSAFFGAVGYGCVEGAKYGISVFRSIQWTNLTEPAFFKTIESVNATHVGIVCVIFTVVDLVTEVLFKAAFKNYAHRCDFVLARLAVSIISTAAIAMATGLVQSLGVASIAIITAIIAYSVIKQIALAYNKSW